MNKTKKFIAGACLGLVGIGCLSGCDSKLSIDQKSLNEAIVHSNQLFEMQNNNSEQVKDVLMNYLFNDIKSSADDTSFQIKATAKNYSEYGHVVDVSGDDHLVYKYYYNKDTNIAKYFADCELGALGSTYRYREMSQTKTGDTTTYTVKDYEIKDQEKILTTITADSFYDRNGKRNIELFSYVNYWGIGGATSSTDISLNLITLMEIHEEMADRTTCSIRFNGDEVEFCVNYQLLTFDEGLLSSIAGSQFDIKFVNGRLSKYSVMTVNDVKVGESSSKDRIDYEITRNIQDFAFDTTGYVEK